MRKLVAAALQAVGLSVCAAAGFTIGTGLGLAVLGVGLVMFGVAVERDS